MALTNTPPSTVSSAEKKSSLRARLTGKWFYWTLGGCLIVALFAFYFIFWQLWMAVQDGSSDLSTAAAQAQTQDLQKNLQTLQQHDQELKSLPQSDLDRMAIALPQTPDAPNFLTQLEALSLQAGMTDVTFSTTLGSSTSQAAAPAPDDGTAAKPLTIDGHLHFTVPTYAQLKSVIDEVQKNLRLIDITNVSYAPATHSADITFVAYYMN